MHHTGEELSVANGIIQHHIASALVDQVYDCIQLQDDFLLQHGKIKSRGKLSASQKF